MISAGLQGVSSQRSRWQDFQESLQALTRYEKMIMDVGRCAWTELGKSWEHDWNMSDFCCALMLVWMYIWYICYMLVWLPCASALNQKTKPARMMGPPMDIVALACCWLGQIEPPLVDA